MKNIFTSISLAAMTFMATMPGMAQQPRQLTDQQKAEVVATVIPTVFDQVKQISGIDIKALATPTIENVLESPLFGMQSMLRAQAAAPAITLQPDSVVIPNIENLGKLKIEFSDYKTYSLTKLVGIPTELSFPEKVSTNISMMGMNIPVNVTLKAGEKNGLLPFSTFNIGIDLGLFNSVLGSDKAIDIITLTETQNNGVYTYDIVITDDARKAFDNLGKLTSALPDMKEEAEFIASLVNMPNYKITADMTKMQAGEINASLRAVVSSTILLPLGDAQILLKKDGTKEIITTDYEDGTATIEGFEKTVVSAPVVTGNEMKTVRTYYEVEGTNRPATDEDWGEGSVETTTLHNAEGNAIDPNNLVASIVGGIIKDMTKGTAESFSMLVEEDNKPESELTVETSMSGTQAAVATIEISEATEEVAEYDGLETVMSIKVTLPLKGETVTVDFIPEAPVNKPVATMYIKSNLGGILTGNEAITPELDAQIIVAENGLYINGCENAQYTIVSMAGKVVANGIISGDNAFVATPALQRGQIYIATVIENGAKKSIKFIQK